MKPLALLAFAALAWTGCAEEAVDPADVEDIPPAEVVTEPADDAMTDTMMLDDDVVIDEGDLEAGEVEDTE